MTVFDSAELPLQPAADAPTTKFAHEQALDWLAANPNTGKTIREIAAIWGWSRSTTQRFVSRVRQERGTSLGQGI